MYRCSHSKHRSQGYRLDATVQWTFLLCLYLSGSSNECTIKINIVAELAWKWSLESHLSLNGATKDFGV
jgi:hypothetical protein